MPNRRSSGLVGLAISMALALAVGAVGGLATVQHVNTWYPGLRKPEFNPPNAVFGPVWTLLYVLMAIAAWRVFNRSEGGPRRRALLLYGLQLSLNLAWSLIFFGLEAPFAALLELVVLLAALAANVWAFWRLDRTAGLLLAPYALWTCFAFVLNLEIWRLNR